MQFKEAFYKNYVSTHSGHLYRKPSLESLQREFSVWNYYYRSLLPISKESACLDIGCGMGSFVYYLHQLEYLDTSGIDVSAEQITMGLQLGISKIEVADIREFLLKSNQFDCIIARDVIEHFTRQEAVDLLTLVAQKLKPGGRFIMQVPNGQGLFYTSIFYGDYTHEMAYTESSVRQLFLNTGFISSACYPTGPVPHTLKGRVRWLLWKWKIACHRFWKMVETGNPGGIFTSNLIAVATK